MSHQAVVTFTARGSQRIISEGGSQAWKLDTERMKGVEFLVCTQNTHNGPWGGMDHEHRSAFLVGRVSGVVPSTDTPGRWLIAIDEFARINMPEVWDKSRFPVRYTTLEDLGIDLSTLTFQSMPCSWKDLLELPDEESEVSEVPPLIENHSYNKKSNIKQTLAELLGIPKDDLEITLRF